MSHMTHQRSASSDMGCSSQISARSPLPCEAQRVEAGDRTLSKMAVQLMKSVRSMLRKLGAMSFILTRSTRTKPTTRLRPHTLTPRQRVQVSRPLRLRQERLHLPLRSRLQHRPKLNYSPHRLELLRGPGLSGRIFLVLRGPNRVQKNPIGLTLRSRRRHLMSVAVLERYLV